MLGLGWSTSRAVVSLGLAATLAIFGSEVAEADSTHGQTGNYIFIDGAPSNTGATCVYTGPNVKLTSIIVKPPKVWWPNTNSSNERQHGTVGWRAIVQTSPTGTAPWTFAKKSSIQKKIAYEDQTAPYGDSTKAPFTKKTLSWNAPQSPTIYVRVVVQAIWYHRDGTVMGWWKHPIMDYHFTYGVYSGTFTNECNNYGLAG